MTDRYTGDDRALPIVQAIAGVAEPERDRPVNPLPDPQRVLPTDARASSGVVEAEQLEPAQAVLRARDRAGLPADDLRPWFTDIVSDHMLSYGHGAIYSQKAFELLERLGWERADTVLPHLVPTIVYGTREDKLPYMWLFIRGLDAPISTCLPSGRSTRRWTDDGTLLSGPARPLTAPSGASGRSPRSRRAPASTACSTRRRRRERAPAALRHRR